MDQEIDLIYDQDYTCTNNCPYYTISGDCSSPIKDHPYECNNKYTITDGCIWRPRQTFKIIEEYGRF